MKKILFSILLLSIFTILTACSDKNADQEDMVPQFLDVQLSVNPEQGNVNEPVTFAAKVMYGDKEVTDPDEVEFEIWRANDENHEKIQIEHAGNGVYELKKSFSVEGTYYVYAHVTAERMHSMPKKEFVIGQRSEPEDEGASTEMDEEDHASMEMDEDE